MIKHLINDTESVKAALLRLNELPGEAVLFLVNSKLELVGSLTDGDIRRGLISGLLVDDSIEKFCNKKPKYLIDKKHNIDQIRQFKKSSILIFPLVDENRRVVKILNLTANRSFIPVDVVIMAGGRGERLKPLTDHLPKPLLKVGDKPIIEHNIDRLSKYGVSNVWISVRYLGNLLMDYFGNGVQKGLNIQYVTEVNPLGTIGAIAQIEEFQNEYILIMNSDILTNVDFEELFMYAVERDADLTIVCVPYEVKIPFAVIETNDYWVTGLKEKPTYTHFSNAGIYLAKRKILELIKPGQRLDAPELIHQLLDRKMKVAAYNFPGYWLDIGRLDDFNKANADIKHLTL